MNHHHNQKTQLSENPDQVKDFDQGKHHTEDKQNSANVRGNFVDNIKDGSPLVKENTNELEVIPEVFEVLISFLLELSELIHQEIELDELTYHFTNNPGNILYSVMEIRVYVITYVPEMIPLFILLLCFGTLFFI